VLRQEKTDGKKVSDDAENNIVNAIANSNQIVVA